MVIGSVFALYYIRHVLTPFIISFGLAYILDPAADKLESWRINRTAGIFLLIFFSLLTMSLAGIVLFSVSKVQMEGLLRNIPGYIDKIKEFVIPVLKDLPIGNDKLSVSLVEEWLKDLGNIPLNVFGAISSYLLQTISSFASVIIMGLNLLIIPVASFYFLRDIDLIKEGYISFVPVKYRENTVNTLNEINTVLKNFLQGQIMVSFILSVLYSAGLYFCGTPLWLIIGIAAGFGNLAPFLGFIIGIIPALILTFLQYHDWQHLLGVVLVFGVVQLLEGTLITPKIIGDKLGLHPLAIIFAVFLGGAIFGFFGVLLAVPAAAVFNVCFKKVFKELRIKN